LVFILPIKIEHGADSGAFPAFQTAIEVVL